MHEISHPDFTIGTPSSATVTIRGTDSAPDFGTGSVTAKSYTYGTAITEFQLPAATGGNGGVSYTASGLPAGLVFDADGSGSCPGTEPREICGTPSAATSGAQTVTITAADADSNTASSDEDTLTFTVTVTGSPAALASAPSPLTEGNLNGATLTVTLPSGVAFVGGVNPSSFALVATPAIPGLSISGGGFSTRLRQGVASATLTLATGAGYGFNVPSTLAVRVAAAATTASGALTSAALAVSPTPGVTLSRRSLALQEAPGTNNANRGTYTMVLDSPPAAGCLVRVDTSTDNTDVLPDNFASFNASNWSTPQTFAVLAGQDADGVHDAATISHSIHATLNCPAAGYTTSLAIDSVSVSVRDDEAPSASISATNPATLTEANLNNATVTVALANGATFGSGVTTASFELATDIPGVSVDSVSSVSSGDTSAVLTLAFSGNFTGVETLAVKVLNAAHSASEDLTTGAVNVTPTPGIALSRTTLTLEEDPAAGGGTNANVGTYTVALTADPTTASGGDCDVWIRVTSNNADVAVDNDSSPQVRNLVFSGSSNPAVSNWNTPQTVTVTASGDGDGADDVATISHSRTAVCGGGFFGRPTLPSVTVNVNDDETPALVIDADPSTPATADAGPLALDELSSSGSNSESFTVKLAVPPTANVTVNVYSDDTPVTVDNVNAMGILPLTFTTGNWSTAQTVTLTAAQDADGAHESVTITAEVPAADTTEYAGVSASLTATVNDDEAPAASISATNPAALTEGSLNTATVTVELANATYLSGVTTASFELVTDIPGVSVDSVSSVSSGDASATLTLAFSGDFAGIETLAVRVLAAAHSGTADVTTATVNVTASAGVTVSKSSLVLEEAPGTTNANRGTYTIVLEAPFSGCSTVQVQTTSDNPDVTVFPTARTFSSTNPAQGWNRPQTYTVTAAQDTDGIPDTATISHSININCDADGYVTSLAIDDLEVTVNDDEVGVGIATTPAALTESTLHGATVAVALNGTTFAAGAAAAGAGAFALVTTPAIANLSIAQVSGLTDGGTTATLTLAFTGNFRALPTLAVRVPAARHTGSGALTSNAVTVTANAGVTVSEASLSLNEAPGSTNANRDTYTVVLDSPPTGCSAGVFVDIASNNADVTANLGTINFTSSSWNTPSTVTVTAAQDDDGADDAATISHNINGTDTVDCTTGYVASLSIASISVAVDDDETPGLVFDADPSTPSTDDAEPLNLDELAGSTTNADDYSVRLAAQPTQTVTVAVSSPDTGAVTVGTSTLTFTTTNWDTAQTVTLTAAQDLDGQDESVEIAHAASTATNSEYTGLSATFEAAVDDDETAAIVFSPTSLSVNEQNTATYTVALATLPTESVTVAITGAGSGISIDLTSLTFTTGNWNTAQTVTASAIDDTNSANEQVTLTHTATGGDYDTLTADLEVTAQDDDTPSLNVSATTLTVPENDSRTYTIRLNTLPTASVTVTVNGAASGVTVDTDSATTGDQNTLTFTTGSWDTNQTVTVSAAEDDNGRDETVSLTHTASGGGYGTITGTALPGVSVTTDDNDTPAVVIDADPQTTTVDEAGPLALQELSSGTNTASYTVRLGTEPSAAVTVTITSADAMAVSVNDTDSVTSGVQNTLAFTTANWDTAQTVTLTAVQDADAVDESEVVTNAATSTDSQYAGLSATITATVDDDETPGFVFDADTSTPSTADAEPLNLDELAGSTTNADDYSVRLAAQPTQTVTVAVSSPDTGAVTVGTSTLTFTTTNWDTAQTVTLTAVQDLDGRDESVEIAHAASTATTSEYTGVSADFEAAVDDDETPAIVFSPTALNVNEANTATYTVVLATLPSGAVTVAITGAGSGISIDLTSLSFTTSNWNTAQTVTASAANDDNSVNESVTLTHTATGADYDTLTADLEVTAQDNDQPSLNVSTASLTVPENDSRTYTIRLNTEPTASVTVTVNGAADGVTVDTDGAMNGDQNTLTFTTGSWDTNQTVTVSAAEDDDGVDETVSLTHTASGGGYGSLTGAALPGVSVTADDNDTPAVLLDANPTTPNVDEAGPLALQELASGTNSAGYTARLATEPTATVTLTVTSADTGAVTVNDTQPGAGVQNTLTFTSSNWDTRQTVTLTAAQDDDSVNESVVVTNAAGTASMSEYTNVSATLTATVQDDEAPGFVFDADPTTTNADEAGPLNLDELPSSGTNSDSYAVRLTSQPTQDVTVAITSPDTGAVTVGTSTLTFTTTNWDTRQTVTLTAQQDLDGADESVDIDHAASTASTSEYTGITDDFEAAVDDDETPAITLSPTSLNVNEQNTATYTVALATQPKGGGVTVAITGEGDGISIDLTNLTFTASNWNTARTVRASAANDLNAANEQVTLTHTASGADYDTLTADLMVTAQDNDQAGLNVNPLALTVDEGSSNTYTVRLNTQPSAAVTVTVSGAGSGVTVDTDSATGDQNTLTFTDTTWDTNQTVTVSAAEDDNGVDETVTLSHAATGGDYGSLTGAALPGVSVTADDNDTPAVLLDADPSTNNVDEAGPLALQELASGTNSAGYTARLATEPTATVTLTVTSADTGAVTVNDTQPGAGVQNTLTFTSANWDTRQTVTLTAAQDADSVAESVVVTNAASTASMSEYNGLSATLTATVEDDEAPGFVFDADTSTPAVDDAGPLMLDELAGSATNSDDYSVRLSAQPTQDVTVTITSDDTGAVTVGTSTLTFTTTNWDTAQTVTLTAQQDLDAADEEVDIEHAASTAANSEYTGVTGDFDAEVDDDETAAITLSPTALNVNEQDSAAYTVALSSQPTGAVTVAITGVGDGISIDVSSLTFSTSNWNTAVTVTASAVNDQNSANESVTLTHTAGGADYDTLTADLEVTALDDDTPSLRVTPTALTVPEAESRTYTVRLNTQPSATVTVTVNGAASGVTVDTDGATGDQNTLTFTDSTWDTNQTVTVSAAADDNGVDEVVSLSHAAAGGDYGTITGAALPGVSVTADDDDTPAVVLDTDPQTLTMDEPGPVALKELAIATDNSLSHAVRLATEPTATVTVTITSADDGAVTVDTSASPGLQNTLTFTATNWDTRQSVTLAAAQDADGVAETVVITYAAATAAMSEYTNVSATLTATVEDDEAPAFVFDADPSTAGVVDAAPLNLDELSTSPTNADDYSVKLSSQPTQDVTVAVGSPDTGAVTVGASSLTFTTANWNTPQTVTATAAQDLDGADESVDVAHAASTATPSEYTGITGDFEVAVDDDETAGLTLSPTSLTVQERQSDTYTVVLDTEPKGGSVTVSIGGAGDGISASPTRLVFTASNWNTARTVTARAADDANSANEVVTLTHAAGGADYDGVSEDLEVTASDDDQPGLRVSPTQLTVREEAAATYRVRLNAQPSAAVTVTVGGATAKVGVDTDPDTTGDQTELAFDATDWNRWKTVRVRGVDDDDGADETASLTHAVSGASEYTGLALEVRPGVAVTVDDRDVATVALSLSSLALSEGGGAAAEGTWTVRLANLRPTGPVSVAVTSGDPAVALTGAPVTLNFTTANWDTAQSVAARAVDDDNAASERVEVRHAATGANYGGAEAVLRVVVTDDEAPPDAPVGLAATPGDGSAALSWSNPENPSITRYERRFAQEGAPLGEWRRAPGAGPNTTSLTVSGLVNGRAYVFEVRAGNEIGDGEASRTVARLAAAPAAPATVPDAALAAAVRTVVGKSAEQPLTAGDLAQVLELDLSRPAQAAGRWRAPQTGGEAVKDLRGMEAMPNLRRLYLDNNEVADLSPLLGLRYLEHVSVRGNPLTSDSVFVHAAALRARGVEVLLDAATLATLADPGLRRAVEVALGKDPGAALTEGDLLTLSSLSAEQAGVASLSGLEAASRLQSLTLAGNAPAAGGAALSLSPLAGLRALTHLDLSDNGLTDVSALAGMSGLRSLLLAGNAVEDLSPLFGLTGLEELTLSRNGLADISALAGLTGLRQLWLDGNALTSVRPLRGLSSLVYLHLGDNRIMDIGPLAGLADLRRLWLPGNRVEDVSALTALWRLRRLDLERNRVSGVSPLAGLPELSQLRLGWNRVADVSALTGHPGLAAGGTLGLRGNPLGEAALEHQVPALRRAGAAVVVGWPAPLFPSASDASGRSGFVRVLNRSETAGEALVEALDEAGRRFGPVRLALGPRAAAHFNPADLENGNAAKGLPAGVGPPTRGSWRLLVSSALDIEVLAYLRAPDGSLAAMHGELPREDERLSAFFFNPGGDREQRSSLRVFNPGASAATVWPWGVDDAGRGRSASGVEVPAGTTVLMSARELESSRWGRRGLGDGEGRWRLRLGAPWPLAAQSLLEGPDGSLSNLSSAPVRAAWAVRPDADAWDAPADWALRLPLFPPAGAHEEPGRDGLARVVNQSPWEGWAQVAAVDDAGVRAGPVRLRLPPRAAVHFDSAALEAGDADQGPPVGVGAPTKGAWRLELRGNVAFAAAAYARSPDGSLASLHETAPSAEGSARVALFNPASNARQRSQLRLANDGAAPARATITALDDAGAEAGPVSVTVPAGEALTLTAVQLEQGGKNLGGALGDGEGKWRLTVAFDHPLAVMSLVENPAGLLSNLSATARP